MSELAFKAKRELNAAWRECRNGLAEVLRDNPQRLAYWLAVLDQRHRARLKELFALRAKADREDGERVAAVKG
jgi:rubrerythrin